MSQLKTIFAVLLMAAIASVVPQAQAQVTVKAIIAGSSGIWQAMGVGTYKDGACPTGSHPGCAHYVNKKFNLNDTRPTLKGGSTVTDVANIWIIWDNTTADPNCTTACNVWAYIKVDSTVGARCYFAQPRCNVNVSGFPANDDTVITLPAPAWGAGTLPPTTVQNVFTGASGIKVTAAAADIRPEDTLYAECRANSVAGGGNDGLNGLGFGVNASGTCPAFGADLAHLQGTDFTSAYPASTSTAHNLAFNISGHDPFSNTAIPAATVVPVGAIPVVLITNRLAALSGVTNASMAELQNVFSGADCSATAFSGATGPFDVYLREPLSGTMNTIEYTAFRLPRDSAGNFAGESQETGITGVNPVNGVPCTVGGKRYSDIGTGEEVKFVLGSNTLNGADGIGYTFFSYGNVSSIASNSSYGYLTVDGADPIFQLYGTTYDPGQPATAGNLPGVADLPAACGGNFPCSEAQIWKGGQSFPNVRNGTYRQWSLVRLVSDGTNLTNAKALVTSAQLSATTTVPDFIPAVKAGTDPGLQLYRSHYTQEGVAPSNTATADKGGDEGGCIISAGSTATKLVQRNVACAVGP